VIHRGMPAEELIAVITSGIGRVFTICILIPLSGAIIASIPDLIRAGVSRGATRGTSAMVRVPASDSAAAYLLVRRNGSEVFRVAR
jgi:hypothetical protein